MLTEERHRLIIDKLKNHSVVYVSELVKELNTSESTIRRDLNFLNKQRKLKKVHGGATPIDDNIHRKDDTINIRQELNVQEKIEIAKKSATYIEKDDLVYIDAGTTTELMIDYINEKDAIYITNGINQAKKLIEKGFRTYMLAGEIKISTEAVVGVEAINSLRKYNFTKGFFGVNGISIERGYTTPEIQEALVKEEAMKRTIQSYILADNSKFEEISLVTFAEIEDGIIITSDIKNKYKEEVKEITEVIEVI